MAEIINKSRQIIEKVIERDLHMIGVSIRQIPHILSKINLNDRIDTCGSLIGVLLRKQQNNFAGFVTCDETWPVAAKKAIGAQKVKLTVFFGANRIWLIHVLPRNKSMTSTIFIDDVLTPLIKDMHDAYPQLDNIYIHFDNATSHNQRATTSFLEGQKVQHVAYPAYGWFRSEPTKKLLQYEFMNAELAVTLVNKTEQLEQVKPEKRDLTIQFLQNVTCAQFSSTLNLHIAVGIKTLPNGQG
ncbi:MAG: hypothetical protein EZS28_038050 [Streblomastix strix]|uniref:Tc1-like transposase DDE domain-containing protein n=1 Tax=Streblomastix strix TaxID=222440 RepID=A0A5J4U875_9EUKA|nr:MAG: hypothetical protein EZS28_038050 [Streblomastix strix]